MAPFALLTSLRLNRKNHSRAISNLWITTHEAYFLTEDSALRTEAFEEDGVCFY